MIKEYNNGEYINFATEPNIAGLSDLLIYILDDSDWLVVDGQPMTEYNPWYYRWELWNLPVWNYTCNVKNADNNIDDNFWLEIIEKSVETIISIIDNKVKKIENYSVATNRGVEALINKLNKSLWEQIEGLSNMVKDIKQKPAEIIETKTPINEKELIKKVFETIDKKEKQREIEKEQEQAMLSELINSLADKNEALVALLWEELNLLMN